VLRRPKYRRRRCLAGKIAGEAPVDSTQM